MTNNLEAFLSERIAEDEYAIAHSPKMSDPFDLNYPFLNSAAIERLKRECAAKRLTLEFYERVSASGEPGAGAAWGTLNVVLEQMASPWRDHPDFDPTWAEWTE